MRTKMVCIQTENFDMYVTADKIMQREGFKWILRSLPEYEVIDQGQFRADLAERNMLDLHAIICQLP